MEVAMKAPYFICARNFSKIAVLTVSLLFALSTLASLSTAAAKEVMGGSTGASSLARRAIHDEGNQTIDDCGITITAGRSSARAYYNRAIFVRAVAVTAQTPIITITLGQDQIGNVKTAPGITTRLAFPEKVTDSICGDLYDPASGKGTFIVQNSGSDVFLKPISAKGASNLFVKTGEGSRQHIYSFDLTVVSAAQAHRVVNVVPAAPVQPPSQPKTKAPVQSGVESTKESPKEPEPVSPEPLVITSKPVKDVGAATTNGASREVTSDAGAAEPSKLVEPLKREEAKQEEPKPQPARITRKSSGVLAGEAIRKPQPFYPPQAKAARVSGPVVVEVTVDESGNVIEAHAVSGHPLLKDAAVSAARGWKFSPTKVSGEPVKIVRTITFEFSL